MELLVIIALVGLLLFLTFGAGNAQMNRPGTPAATSVDSYEDDGYRYDPGDAEVVDGTAEEVD
jgi:hypothetical protein